MNDQTSRPAALVTGASRGIGAAVAGLLARRGADVAVNYRSKGPRAEQVAETVRAEGGRALLVQADMTNDDERRAMAEQIAGAFGRLDLLVLNASGGLEKDKPAEYAMLLNRDAQIATVRALLPLMPPGGRIVFVTSHWAHFHGQKPVLGAYEPIAASKKAGEDALRALMPDLERRGIRLVIVSGDVIEGTITPKLLERAQPGLLAHRRNEVGTLPTVEEFAAAIVEAAFDPALASGAVIFVGATD